MSNFLYHEPCEDCGSSDAKAVYDDEHTFCFSCKTTRGRKNMSLNRIERLLIGDKKVLQNNELPYDVTDVIPQEPYAWLVKYDLKQDDIRRANLLWSPSEQMLIYSYYGAENNGKVQKVHPYKTEAEANLVMWQGRYFPARVPKVCTYGNVNSCLNIHSADSGNDLVVVVEDPVSAIKVSRKYNALGLFGAHLSIEKAVALSWLYKRLVLWLDQDKTAEMIKFFNDYRVLFEKVRVVSTERDPKDNSMSEITDTIEKINRT